MRILPNEVSINTSVSGLALPYADNSVATRAGSMLTIFLLSHEERSRRAKKGKYFITHVLTGGQITKKRYCMTLSVVVPTARDRAQVSLYASHTGEPPIEPCVRPTTD